MKDLHEFRLSKEYLLKRLEKHLEKGFIYRSQLAPNKITKLKELGLVSYSDKRVRYDINLELYNEMKEELL